MNSTSAALGRMIFHTFNEKDYNIVLNDIRASIDTVAKYADDCEEYAEYAVGYRHAIEDVLDIFQTALESAQA